MGAVAEIAMVTRLRRWLKTLAIPREVAKITSKTTEVAEMGYGVVVPTD